MEDFAEHQGGKENGNKSKGPIPTLLSIPNCPSRNLPNKGAQGTSLLAKLALLSRPASSWVSSRGLCLTGRKSEWLVEELRLGDKEENLGFSPLNTGNADTPQVRQFHSGNCWAAHIFNLNPKGLDICALSVTSHTLTAGITPE